MATPALTNRDQAINAETESIMLGMFISDLSGFVNYRVNGYAEQALTPDVMRKHARETATRAYDAAQERATLDKLNNLWASE